MIDEELVDGQERIDTSPYEPGTPPDLELADAVIHAFLKKVGEERSKYLPSFVRAKCSVYNTLVSLLGEEEELDEHAFLDILIPRYAREEGEVLRYADCLFSPVLQVLYTIRGCNDFDLNLYSYGVELIDIFAQLEGTEENLLVCSYGGESVTVGTQARYCDITLHSPTNWLGDGAEHSRFTFGYAEQFGDGAYNCDFFLTEPYSREQLSKMRAKNFYKRGNRLFLMKGLL